MTTLPATFTAKVRPSDCLVWIGATNTGGYGITTIDGRQYLAHRVAYEAEYGPIPEGMALDHLCRVRNCVRPEHLQPVTTAENTRRGRRARGLQVGDTCSNGHLIGAGDLYERKSGTTECRPCRSAAPHNGPNRKRPTQQRHAEHVSADLELIARGA